MIVEIRGVNFNNKGAELMLHAVVQKLQEWDKENIVAIRPKIGKYSQRSKVGLYQLLYTDKKIPFINSIIDSIVNIAPYSLRNSLGLLTYSDIDAVLDASGFNYSDQWGLQKTVVMAELAKRCKKQGKKVILLPQAFGPFENVQIRKAFLDVLNNADLVFPRDKISYQYLMNLATNQSVIKIAPDFTNLIKGSIPEYFKISDKRACVIPNTRMLDKTSEDVKSKYFEFLATCIDYLKDIQLKPFILIHETSDDSFISELNSKLGETVEFIVENDPLYIKGILGKCHVVVSSRFHGLVSALSQGVPCLATGWSHKYQMLMEDYNCAECLVSPLDSKDEIIHKLKLVTDEATRSVIVKNLNEAGSKQRQLASDMWSEVYAILNN